MNLNSARELKQSLREKLLGSLTATARTRSTLGEAAQPLSLREEAPPTFALGVARRSRNDYTLALRIQQRAMQNSREVELIAKQAKGEVDIRYIGVVEKRSAPWHRQRQRPLRIGSSIGHFNVTAGTLGGIVRPRGGKAQAALSNNHVLANENRGKPGDAILQPGALDGGKELEAGVAILTDFVRLKRVGGNFVDAAYAILNAEIEVDPGKLTGLGKLQGISSVFLDEGAQVAKIGRTTGLTRGRITAFELDNVSVGFGVGVLRFDNQIEIEGEVSDPFSDGGDSGSLILGEDLRAVALLFAGSDQGGANGQGLTYANPIHPVLDGLKVELLF